VGLKYIKRILLLNEKQLLPSSKKKLRKSFSTKILTELRQFIVDFTKTLQAAFAPIYFCQKFQSQTTVNREKLRKTLLFKKSCS